MNIGDIVELKSGGPKMTVDTITGLYATCTWFHAVYEVFPNIDAPRCDWQDVRCDWRCDWQDVRNATFALDSLKLSD